MNPLEEFLESKFPEKPRRGRKVEVIDLSNIEHDAMKQPEMDTIGGEK